jgi:hypothetical protein
MQDPAEHADPSTSAPLTLVRAGSRGNLGRALRANWRLLSVAVTLGLGITFVLLGWYGAAHTNIVTEQIPYLISGGLLGMGLIIVAGFMAYSFLSERQNEDLRREIARALSATRPAPGTIPSRISVVFALPGGRSFHLSGCPIIEGKEGVRELPPERATAEGLTACKLCAED